MNKKIIFLLCILSLVIIILTLSNKPNFENHIIKDINLSCNKTYGLSFPPFSNPDQIDFTLRELNSLNLNRIRIAINWENREPQKGEFNWEPMDYRIQKTQQNGISVLLSVHSNGPDWACSEKKDEKSCVYSNEADFKNYITEILTRYKIDKIQFGNEWDNNYIGTMEEYVKFNNILYNITKKLSPNTKIVLGGITRGYPITEIYCNQGKNLDFSDIEFSKGYSQERILSKLDNGLCSKNYKEKVLYVLDNAKYDILDIHLYDDVENWHEYISLLPKDKPIIVSEFGGPSSVFEKTNQKYQAERVREYLKVIEQLPIEEAYYFKLVDSPYSYHKNSSLFDEDLNKKMAYSVFFECTKNISK